MCVFQNVPFTRLVEINNYVTGVDVSSETQIYDDKGYPVSVFLFTKLTNLKRTSKINSR